MRVWRALLTAGGVLAGAASALGQAPIPDNGPVNQVELVTGEVIKGQLTGAYWAEGADRSKEGPLGVKVRRDDGIVVFVPWDYFSAQQRYWYARRWTYPPDRHPVYRPPEAQNLPMPEPDAKKEFLLARQALWAGIWDQAKAHYEHSVKLAESDGDDQTDPKAWQAAYLSNLEEYGLKISTKDGRWVDPDTFYSEQGYKKWQGKWYPREEYDKKVREAVASGKRSLVGLIAIPDLYQRVDLGLVRSFPGRWVPAKKGEFPQVRFTARFLALDKDKFPPLARFKPGEFWRVRVQWDDCNHVYVKVKGGNKALMERVEQFTPGEPVVVYGRLIVGSGLILIECDALVLR